jgi:GDP-L-fucose synthase
MINKASKVYIAGHSGLVGSAILRRLEKEGYSNLIYKSHADLDLSDTRAVEAFFEQEKPEYVFDAAAKVGGIIANSTLPADFIYENLVIQNNVIHACYKFGVKKLIFLGSSCIYPKDAPQPMKEEYLLTGPLEPTNIAYSVAKIAGVIMCQSFNHQYGTKFVSVMPCNTYGPNDHYDPQMAHVLPALIRRFFEAKTQRKPDITLWGTGVPLREFIHVDDVANGAIFLMNNDTEFDLFNLGTGEEISIKNLAELIQGVSGYEGRLLWDDKKPNGMMRKVMDMSRLYDLGWRPAITLEEGIKSAYAWYIAHYNGIDGQKIH